MGDMTRAVPFARASALARRAGVVVLSVGLMMAVAACGSESEPEVVIELATPTPTPVVTASPTATPPPPFPWAAERIERGQLAAELSNPTSGGFPPPPPLSDTPIVDGLPAMRMVAPGLEIDHYITPVAVVDGQMMSPEGEHASYAIGWYPSDDTWEFGVPGEAGNVVFSAHETWNKMQGPFFNLHRAHVGDDIYLVMADGERRHYQVHSVTRYSVETIPMSRVLWPRNRPEAEEWLTLYTCGGEILYDASGFGTYFDRDVLMAKWVGSDYPDAGSPGTETPDPDGYPAEVTPEPVALGGEGQPSGG